MQVGLRNARAVLALLALGSCVGAPDVAVEPVGAPSMHRTPRDPSGPVELWGAWLEEAASAEFLPYLAQARGLAAVGRLEAVLDLLDDAALTVPPEPVFYAVRAGALLELGFPRAAERQLELALNLDPACAQVWWELALVRERLGLPSGADEALRNARELAAR